LLATLNELRPSRRSELWHPRGKRQGIVRVSGTPNASRSPHPLSPRNLDLGETSALDGRGQEFFNELQLEDVFTLLPTLGPFVCVDHLPAEIRAAPETHDLLDGVRPRSHQLDRGSIIPDIRSGWETTRSVVSLGVARELSGSKLRSVLTRLLSMPLSLHDQTIQKRGISNEPQLPCGGGGKTKLTSESPIRLIQKASVRS
jgi:hypothetical protein